MMQWSCVATSTGAAVRSESTIVTFSRADSGLFRPRSSISSTSLSEEETYAI